MNFSPNMAKGKSLMMNTIMSFEDSPDLRIDLSGINDSNIQVQPQEIVIFSGPKFESFGLIPIEKPK